MPNIMSLGRRICFKNCTSIQRQDSRYFRCPAERRKVNKKQIYM